MPTDIIQDFVREIMGGEVEILHTVAVAAWGVKGNCFASTAAGSSEWGSALDRRRAAHCDVQRAVRRQISTAEFDLQTARRRVEQIGEDLNVFRNLARRCYSIQAALPHLGWRTIAHASHVQLTDATFFVREAARQRVLSTNRRSVHAAIQADLGPWVGRFAKDLHIPAAETWRRPSVHTLSAADHDH